MALETQAFPDAPNHKDFPNAILRPGDVCYTTTIYKFLTVEENTSIF
jgi:aldose 1-epimerase